MSNVDVAQVRVKAVQLRFPLRTVLLHPFRGVPDRQGRQPTGAPLRITTTRDESAALEHLEMSGHGRCAETERLGEFLNRGLAGAEARQHGSANRMRQGRKRQTELVGVSHIHFNIALINLHVNYS